LPHPRTPGPQSRPLFHTLRTSITHSQYRSAMNPAPGMTSAHDEPGTRALPPKPVHPKRRTIVARDYSLALLGLCIAINSCSPPQTAVSQASKPTQWLVAENTTLGSAVLGRPLRGRIAITNPRERIHHIIAVKGSCSCQRMVILHADNANPTKVPLDAPLLMKPGQCAELVFEAKVQSGRNRLRFKS